MYLSIGEQIRKARLRKGLSQRDVARALNVSQAAVTIWERGESLPRGHNLNMLSELLGVGLELYKDSASSESERNPLAIAADEVDLEATSDKTEVDQYISRTNDRPSGGEHLKASRVFMHRIVGLLHNLGVSSRLHSIIDGPNNRRWIVDLKTQNTVVCFVHPINWIGTERGLPQVLWRLCVLRKFLGMDLNYVLVLREPSYDSKMMDESIDAFIHSSDRVQGILRDAEFMGIRVCLAKSAEQAADYIAEVERHPNEQN